MCRIIIILISNWPRTRKFSQLLWAERTVTFGHALRPIFMLWLVKIWLVSSCRKCMQHLETCLLIVEANSVLCQLVMFLTIFFHWMYKIVYRCYQESSVIHVWCLLGFWLRNAPLVKLEIRFRIASPCLMRKRVEKSQAILALLDRIQELHLEW